MTNYEYVREDFVDDSIEIDFPLPQNVAVAIEEYMSYVDNEMWNEAYDYNDNLDVILKNGYGGGYYSFSEWKLLEEKYKIR